MIAEMKYGYARSIFIKSRKEKLQYLSRPSQQVRDYSFPEQLRRFLQPPIRNLELQRFTYSLEQNFEQSYFDFSYLTYYCSLSSFDPKSLSKLVCTEKDRDPLLWLVICKVLNVISNSGPRNSCSQKIISRDPIGNILLKLLLLNLTMVEEY